MKPAPRPTPWRAPTPIAGASRSRIAKIAAAVSASSRISSNDRDLLGSASWFVFSAEKKRFVRMGADLAELHEALWQDVGSIFGEEYSYLISRAQSNVPGAAAMAAKAVMFQNKLSLDRTYRAAIIQAWEAAMRNRR